MDDINATVVLITALVGVAATLYQLIRSNWEQRVAVGNSFRSVVDGLTSHDQVQRLGSAILLRRFFNTDSEFARRRWLLWRALPYADDAIDVIAATPRAEPTGHVQKTLGDGLAFAPRHDLRRRDFQETNLRGTYLSLEGAAGPTDKDADARLDLSEADFYMAELDGASFRKSRCVGTVFYRVTARAAVFRDADLQKANFSLAHLPRASFRDATLKKASFNDADLRGATFKGANASAADFRGADLRGTVFDGTTLQGADFTGAVGLPAELRAHLDRDGVFQSPEPVDGATPTGDTGLDTPRFFLSVPNDDATAVPGLVEEALRENGARPFDVVRITRDQYHEHRHLAEIREAIQQCAGVIVVGLPQLHVKSGVWRESTEEESVVVDEGLPTPWNDIEAGVAVGLDVPVLAIRAGSRAQGIFGLAQQNAGFELIELGAQWTRAELTHAIQAWATGVAG